MRPGIELSVYLERQQCRYHTKNNFDKIFSYVCIISCSYFHIYQNSHHPARGLRGGRGEEDTSPVTPQRQQWPSFQKLISKC